LSRSTIASGKPLGEKAADAANILAVAPAESTSAKQLIQSASEKMKSGDWSGATATLDKVKERDPVAPGLWVR
jgi:outer membrane protein assembly factor BamD (BamD/ComL family)